MDIKSLLEIRKRIRSKKPDFVRQGVHKKISLKRKWRKPKGLHSKLRLKIRGKPRPISQGYRSPKKVRGLSKTGLQVVLVSNLNDLKKLNPKKHCLTLSSTLGKRKKIQILDRLKGFEITNMKDPSKYLKDVEEQLNEKKKEKEKPKKTPTINKEKGEKLSDKVTEGEKKEIEKRKKNKILTKRN